MVVSVSADATRVRRGGRFPQNNCALVCKPHEGGLHQVRMSRQLRQDQFQIGIPIEKRLFTTCVVMDENAKNEVLHLARECLFLQCESRFECEGATKGH